MGRKSAARRSLGLMTFPAKRTSTPEHRFGEKLWYDEETGCIEWMGWVDKNGYARFRFRGARYQAHRWAYEVMNGPILHGLEIDHLCRNRRCQNPDHMEPVTGRENTLRGQSPSAKNARLGQCLRGHDLGGPDIQIDSYGRRVCRACRRFRSLAARRSHVCAGEA